MHEIGRAGLGLVVRGGVAKGGLESGRGARAIWDPLLAADMSDLLADMTMMDLMLRFTLGHPSLSTAIVGTQRIEHVRSNAAAAARGPLPAGTHQEFARRLEKLRAA
jgi:aryl-alcohol dehydrogenase-like predicted oxidoreductase